MAHFSEKFPYLFYIKTLAQRLKETSDYYLENDGINTSLGMVLGQINCSQKSQKIINRKLLERALKITGPSVSNLLNKLESLQAIKREISKNDSRNLSIKITNKGLDLLDCTNKALKETDNLLTHGMTDEEKVVFLDLLERSLKNIEEFNRCKKFNDNI